MSRRLSFLQLLLPFVFTFLTISLQMSLDVDAVDTYNQWSVADTRSFFGDSIPFNYIVDGVSFSDNFVYVGSTSNDYLQSIDIEPNDIISSSTLSSYKILTYVSSQHTDIGSVHCKLNVPLSIYHSGGFRFFAASISSFSASLNANFVGNAISSNPGNFVSGDYASRALSSATYTDYYNVALTRWRNGGDYLGLSRLLTYDAVDGIISGLSFDNVLSDGVGRFYLFVATPYTYGDVSHDSPTTSVTTTTSNPVSGDINVDVNVDMSETNGLLDQIRDGISGLAQSILDGLRNLFVPDEQYLQQFSVDMDNLARSHLGGLYQAEQLITDMFDGFGSVTAKDEIYIPPVAIPLAGSELILGDWHVPLKVVGLPLILYEGIAFIVDFLALMAFLRMCRNKVDVFLVPESEVVSQ